MNENFQERRCQLGFHNFDNFLDSTIHIEYGMDIPNEILICKRCKHMTTPKELHEREQYEDNNDN